MINNRITHLIYRSIFLALELIGIINSFGLLDGGKPSLDCLVYYTNLSNYLCFIVMLIVVISTYKHLKNGEIKGNNTVIIGLKFYTTIIILVTFLVYNILLTDNMFGPGWNSLGNLLMHIVCPLMFVLDFFLFDKHHSLKWYDPLCSALLPLLYVVVILIRGQILPADYNGTIYPYFFLNVAEIGIGQVLLWVFILLLVFIVIGYIFYLYDKLEIEDHKLKFYLKAKN